MSFQSEATLSTDLGDRYVRQLLAHFAHRNPTTYELGKGRVDFAFGACDLTVDGETLHLRGEAPTEDELLRVQDVVASHLQRFAWRDMPEVSWTRAG